MASTKPIVCIENVVATATVDHELNLQEIKKKFPETEYNPKVFPGAIFKIASPKSTTLIFRTGNFVCTGTKSEKHAHLAITNMIEKLRSRNIKVKDAETTIQNVVTAVNLGGRIHIETAARVLPRCMYEPEQFPGLIHRQLNPKSVVLLFASGKMVCTGSKSELHVFQAIHQIHSILEEKNLMIYN